MAVCCTDLCQVRAVRCGCVLHRPVSGESSNVWLPVAQIRKKSQAHSQGLQEGDAVVSINGTPVHDKTHDEAVDLIDSAGDTLTLQIYR